MCVFLFLFGSFDVTFHGWTRVLFVSFFFFYPCFVCVCVCVCVLMPPSCSLSVLFSYSACVYVCVCVWLTRTVSAVKCRVHMLPDSRFSPTYKKKRKKNMAVASVLSRARMLSSTDSVTLICKSTSISILRKTVSRFFLFVCFAFFFLPNEKRKVKASFFFVCVCFQRVVVDALFFFLLLKLEGICAGFWGGAKASHIYF